MHAELIERACRLIESHLDEPLTLPDLGTALDVSPGYLQRLFKRRLGISPRQYADARRVERLKASLQGQASVTDAILSAGYGSPSRVYERSDARLGMTPATYRRGGPATAIRYTLVDCPLGRLLLAGTDRGVCAVYLGDDDAMLEAELAREFHAASRARDDAGLRAWADRVARELAGQGPATDLPLDVRATAFQWRVWEELRRIPCGQTRTYRQVALALGLPKAARAVARACATNPVSILIPCHRVVRGDGGLGGYRWGLHRKQAILDREGPDPPAR